MITLRVDLVSVDKNEIVASWTWETDRYEPTEIRLDEVYQATSTIPVGGQGYHAPLIVRIRRIL